MSRCTVPVNPAAACVHSARFGWLNLGGISLFLLAMALACRLARAGENDGGTVDFAESVLPILTKAGCNSGACHGAAAGRGYLNLSLYGSRPNQDYQAIVHAPGGRLLDLQRPEESLLLLKPGGFLDHGGDVRLDPESPAYSTVLRWLKSGAKAGSLETVRNIAILPQESIAVAVGQTARVKIQVDWRNRQEFAHAEHIAIDGAFPAGKRLDAPVQYLHELDQILLTASRP